MLVEDPAGTSLSPRLTPGSGLVLAVPLPRDSQPCYANHVADDGLSTNIKIQVEFCI